MPSQEQRRWNMKQAIANCRVEGFEPSEEFARDAARAVRGDLSFDQLRTNSLNRARELERKTDRAA